MTKDVYEQALDAAMTDLKSLQMQQAEIEKKILSTKQIIVSLKALLGKNTNLQDGLGLKDACLEVLKSEFGPMTVRDVVDELKKIGFGLSRYTNVTSAIKNTLIRLNEAGVLDIKVVKGRKFYELKSERSKK